MALQRMFSVIFREKSLRKQYDIVVNGHVLSVQANATKVLKMTDSNNGTELLKYVKH